MPGSRNRGFRRAVSTRAAQLYKRRVRSRTTARRREAGQALSEYGILLAVTSGINWIGHMTDNVDARTILIAGAVVVTLAFVLTRR
jgi:hypothetical protein